MAGKCSSQDWWAEASSFVSISCALGARTAKFEINMYHYTLAWRHLQVACTHVNCSVPSNMILRQ